MLRMIFAVCLATAPLIVAGQSMIYKVQMPDGSVLYSDNVPSGGKVLEEREAKSTPRVNVQPVQPGKGAPPTQTAVTRPGVPPSSVMRPGIPTKGAAPPANIETLERDLAIAKRRPRTRARAAARRETRLGRWRQSINRGIRSAHRGTGARGRDDRSEAQGRVRQAIVRITALPLPASVTTASSSMY